jgi:hypothetical protein
MDRRSGCSAFDAVSRTNLISGIGVMSVVLGFKILLGIFLHTKYTAKPSKVSHNPIRA